MQYLLKMFTGVSLKITFHATAQYKFLRDKRNKIKGKAIACVKFFRKVLEGGQGFILVGFSLNIFRERPLICNHHRREQSSF